MLKCCCSTRGSPDNIITTIYGPVQGRLRYGAKSGNYYSFQGIPYARPPLGDLRFKVNALSSNVPTPPLPERLYWTFFLGSSISSAMD